jgi:hypothetical protein
MAEQNKKGAMKYIMISRYSILKESPQRNSSWWRSFSRPRWALRPLRSFLILLLLGVILIIADSIRELIRFRDDFLAFLGHTNNHEESNFCSLPPPVRNCDRNRIEPS